ncbi:MAG: type II toxin-antitoxin system RelE/ParE family toxin [Deltaproteobacteria bacterium]|nr:type II toxin-antitoxin system RelE/ParE family toxin [Deltaproteobacteria bacterium]MBF0526562.1 type II toxin-antitoxin system RelE/ParE family toxin [Deltaproteobacteria bacterium]
MDISFNNKKLEKSFNEGAQLEKIHRSLRARKIRLRMKALRVAESLMDFWPPKSGPERCHELTEGRRSGRLSVDLNDPYRLIFILMRREDPVRQVGDERRFFQAAFLPSRFVAKAETAWENIFLFDCMICSNYITRHGIQS